MPKKLTSQKSPLWDVLSAARQPASITFELEKEWDSGLAITKQYRCVITTIKARKDSTRSEEGRGKEDMDRSYLSLQKSENAYRVKFH